MAAIEDLNMQFDIAKISAELIPILRVCDFFDETDQVSLRHRSDSSDSDLISLFKDGVGSLYDSENTEWVGHEMEYKYNHPNIKGTYLEEILLTIQKKFQCRIGRYRIMRLKSKRCYSWHRDPDPFRLHIPVITNDSCFYLTKEGGIEQMPMLGRLYKVNTAVYHTAVNASFSDRVHLVLSTHHALDPIF